MKFALRVGEGFGRRYARMEPFPLAALCRQAQNRVEMDHFRPEGSSHCALAGRQPAEIDREHFRADDP
jgi:hypothetical protein